MNIVKPDHKISELAKHRFGQQLRHQGVGGVHYLERPGSGATLVFLHGIGSNSRSFAPLFKIFPDGSRLIAWDAPGYGPSKPLEKAKPSVRDYATALERLFDGLGLEAVHIIGHSLGTLIAVAFALKAPDRISSITLAACAQGYGSDEGGALPPKAVERLRDLNRLGVGKFAALRAPHLVFDPKVNPSIVACVRTEMARINPEGYTQAVHMLASGDLSSTIALIRQRPAFIIGAEDRITPRNQTDSAIQAWQAAHGETPECIRIPCAGHAVYLQAPQAFADALLNLIPVLRIEAPDHSQGEFHGG